MKWNPLDWFKPIDKAIDIVDKLVLDKDAKAEQEAELLKLKEELKRFREQSYQLELSTKTVPWIDGLHKMGRQILSFLSIIVPSVILLINPEIDPASIAAALTPGAVYNYVKGTGNPTS